MELYTTPPQDAYAQDWLDQLAVHEMRHVVQLDNLNSGIDHILYLIFGEQFIGGLAGFIPKWLLEGDAVNNETALTSTGRGRDASFEMEMKALVTNQKKLFSYDKASIGSFKDYVPDYYHVGYPMVAWSRLHFNASLTDTSMNFFGQYPNAMLNFPLRIHAFTGQYITGFYKEVYTDLKSRWTKQISTIPPDTSITCWNIRKDKDHTSYYLPQIVNDTTVVALKTTLEYLPEFVVLNRNGHEKKLALPGGYYPVDKLSYAKGSFTWAEQIPDRRWANASFNSIKVSSVDAPRPFLFPLAWNVHKVKILTPHTRYFAPAFSHSGNKIATVHISIANDFYLMILDANTGAVLDSIASPDNRWLQLPSWSPDNSSILVLATLPRGKVILRYDLLHKTFTQLTEPTFTDIGLPSESKNYILFEGDFNGTPNVYALHKSDHTFWQVTNEKYGAFSPSLIHEDQLLYSSYCADGYNVVSKPFRPEKFIPLSEVKDESIKLYERSAALEHFNFQDSIVPMKEYNVEPYPKLTHLFQFHSWGTLLL